MTKQQKLAVVMKILIFDEILRNLQNVHFLANEKWQLWRQNYLEPIQHNKHSISDDKKMAKFKILGKISQKVCIF